MCICFLVFESLEDSLYIFCKNVNIFYEDWFIHFKNGFFFNKSVLYNLEYLKDLSFLNYIIFFFYIKKRYITVFNYNIFEHKYYFDYNCNLYLNNESKFYKEYRFNNIKEIVSNSAFILMDRKV